MVAGSFRRAGMRSFVGGACLVINDSGGGGIISLYRCGWDAFVMVVDYLFRVGHAAVTDLDAISIEDFSELVIFGKVLVY